MRWAKFRGFAKGSAVTMDADEWSEADPREQIVRLERRMEELAERIESCRKMILAARLAIGLGALLLAALLFGIVRFDAAALLASIAALLGGVVLLGSNGSTMQEASAELAAAEAQRAALIGSIGLRVVEERPLLH